MIDRLSILTALGSSSIHPELSPAQAMPAALKRFVGSKNGMGVWQRIISEMPLHRVYIEPFLGTGAILKRKREADMSIVSDRDPAAPGLAMVDGTSILGALGDARGILSSLMPILDLTCVVYCDPPYPFCVRSWKQSYYRCEFGTLEEHESLLAILQQLRCNVMLSGYRNGLYDDVLRKWRTLEIPTTTRSGKRSTEVVWMNFDEPLVLHDTRFLGRNFRERERIKRKRTRWVSRIVAMNRLDRTAVLDALNDVINAQVAR